jgi:phenylacetate-CoA ligase
MAVIQNVGIQRLRDVSLANYERFPSLLQDGMCSAYGLQEIVRRRGLKSQASRRMDGIDLFHRDAEAARDMVEVRLRRIMDVARRLPGYADGVPPRPTASALDELHEWPVLRKQDLQNDATRFLSRKPGRTDIFSLTSGTSGTPLRVWRPRITFRELFHSGDVFKAWHGVPLGSRRASFTGKVVVPLSSERIWRLNLPGKQLALSQYHLRPSTVRAYARVLHRWRPLVLDGYTSNLVALAELLVDNDLTVPVPLVVTTCEVLTPPGRALLEQAFGGQVADKYGSSENVAYACECPAGNRHIFQNMGVIEVVDESGRRLPSGEPGRLLLTTLTNDLMPLIRYDVGDMGAADDVTACPCGRTSPILRELLGRQDDLVLTRDGSRPAIFAFNLLRGLEGIVVMQLVQRDLDSFMVRVRLAESSDAERLHFETAIRAAFDRLVGHDPRRRIEFSYDGVIERTPGGKVRNVIRDF